MQIFQGREARTKEHKVARAQGCNMFSGGEPTLKTVGKYYDLFILNYAPCLWGRGKLLL